MCITYMFNLPNLNPVRHMKCSSGDNFYRHTRNSCANERSSDFVAFWGSHSCKTILGNYFAIRAPFWHSQWFIWDNTHVIKGASLRVRFATFLMFVFTLAAFKICCTQVSETNKIIKLNWRCGIWTNHDTVQVSSYAVNFALNFGVLGLVQCRLGVAILNNNLTFFTG